MLMIDDKDLFSRLQEQFEAGSFEYAAVHPQRDEMGTEAGKCHPNVRKIVQRFGGNIVHGWLCLYDGLFAAHSLWELDGVLYEITPLGLNNSPPFIRHSALPDVEWSEEPERSSVYRNFKADELPEFSSLTPLDDE
jgi:hypothetical protein